MSDNSVYAAAPFDHAKADIILRSSDNTYFRVFKLFLSLASPFFETLFDIPQPTDENGDQEFRDGLAVIPVTENSKTLEILLRFCYPCTLAEDPKLEVLQDTLDVFEAARKYSLDVIEKKARQVITNPKLLEEGPLQCFAILHRAQLREEALVAAKHTLTQPLIPPWFQEIELLGITDLLSLLTYRRKCGDAVYALRDNLSWIKSHYGNSNAYSWLSGKYYNYECHSRYRSEADNWIDCGCQSRASKYTVLGTPLQWWVDFLEETFTALRDKPCKETVQATAEKTVQAVKARGCKACSPNVANGMHDFVELFARKIEETVSQIQLQLQF